MTYVDPELTSSEGRGLLWDFLVFQQYGLYLCRGFTVHLVLFVLKSVGVEAEFVGHKCTYSMGNTSNTVL